MNFTSFSTKENEQCTRIPGEGRILRGTGDSGRLSGGASLLFSAGTHPETPGKAGYSGWLQNSPFERGENLAKMIYEFVTVVLLGE